MNQIVENLKIEDMIYEIRGIKVILDGEISATECHRKEVTYEQ